MPQTTLTAPDPVLLQNGDVLSVSEFLHRWDRLPELKHAELIRGRVFVGSPVTTRHSEPHAKVVAWLGFYVAHTPGLEVFDNVTYLVAEDSSVQPDALLAMPARAGGRASTTGSAYLQGAPEFVAEVAYTSRNMDLHAKRELYQQAGVREYLVWRTEEGVIDWWTNSEAGFEPIKVDTEGRRQSLVFPGLCLEDDLLLRGDMQGLLNLVAKACDDNAAHAALCARVGR